MRKSLLDNYLVCHDVFILGFALSAGVLGAVAMQSALIGALMAATVFTLGIIVMRTRRLRRAVNRLALTLGSRS